MTPIYKRENPYLTVRSIGYFGEKDGVEYQIVYVINPRDDIKLYDNFDARVRAEFLQLIPDGEFVE